MTCPLCHETNAHAQDCAAVLIGEALTITAEHIRKADQ